MTLETAAPDVCIIGAGLAGAILAHELATRGVKVLVLEAGPRHDPAKRHSYMQQAMTGQDPWASDDPERDRYTNAGPIEYRLDGNRVKAVGGSTLHWGGMTDRLHETDFRLRTLYGIGDDWPIGYADLEPYYGKAERALGVAGIADDPSASYRSTDYPLPPFPFSYGDQLVEKACRRLGIPVHHIACARNSIPFRGRPQCQAYATCGAHQVCPIGALYTAERHIALAEQTGNALVIPGTSVTRIETDASGRAVSVHCVDRENRRRELRARVFVVAAHAIESARLLLLSRSSRFPDGLANGSGLVGKNFMEHPYTVVVGTLKENVGPYRIGFHTAESSHHRIHDKRDTLGSFKIAFSTGGPKPFELVTGTGNWGRPLQAEVREQFGRLLAVWIALEQLPSRDNSIALDPAVTDRYGDPVPRITFSVGDYEHEAARRGVEVAERIFGALGATDVKHIRKGRFVWGNHHMGTCRMGNDPATSVVDGFLRAHDVPNLYVVGSSAFVTGSAAPPSLTIAALAIRAADHIRGTVRGR